jgi:hypothetical protein
VDDLRAPAKVLGAPFSCVNSAILHRTPTYEQLPGTTRPYRIGDSVSVYLSSAAVDVTDSSDSHRSPLGRPLRWTVVVHVW